MKYKHNTIIAKTYLVGLERAAEALTSEPRTPLEQAQKAEASAEIKKLAAGLERGPLKTWANNLVKEMVRNGKDEG